MDLEFSTHFSYTIHITFLIICVRFLCYPANRLEHYRGTGKLSCAPHPILFSFTNISGNVRVRWWFKDKRTIGCCSSPASTKCRARTLKWRTTYVHARFGRKGKATAGTTEWYVKIWLDAWSHENTNEKCPTTPNRDQDNKNGSKIARLSGTHQWQHQRHYRQDVCRNSGGSNSQVVWGASNSITAPLVSTRTTPWRWNLRGRERNLPIHLNPGFIIASLNGTFSSILHEMLKDRRIKRPEPLTGVMGRSPNSYCRYHRADDHITDECWTLKCNSLDPFLF